MPSIFGEIPNPFLTLAPDATSLHIGTQGEGLIALLNNLVKMSIVLAGVYTFWNLISAGYMFLNASGEAKAVAKAWDKIWQSLVGLLVVAASFVLAAIFGYLIFQDASILLAPRLFTPK